MRKSKNGSTLYVIVFAMGFLGVGHIYTSYSGKSMLDLHPNIIKEGFKVMDFANESHVFDWDGKPVKRLILDKRILFFAVSPDDKTLVAISMAEPDQLLLYDLSSITID